MRKDDYMDKPALYDCVVTEYDNNELFIPLIQKVYQLDDSKAEELARNRKNSKETVIATIPIDIGTTKANVLVSIFKSDNINVRIDFKKAKENK